MPRTDASTHASNGERADRQLSAAFQLIRHVSVGGPCDDVIQIAPLLNPSRTLRPVVVSRHQSKEQQ
jgi:hypothetical protein